jgi:nicotinate-nucleotide--dimethylbenzimidazole phosphoribosyltransferase
MSESVPEEIRAAIVPVERPDPIWAGRAAERQARLTMPPGSLGRLLELGRQLAAIQRSDQPHGRPALVAVFAADHGIAAAGVSSYPSAVTAQMLANFRAGGAAINVLSRSVGADLEVVDVGVAGLGGGTGTANFLNGPAMTSQEARRSLQTGLDLGERWIDERGYRVIALGEMGIGNTTTAAALIAALTGADPGSVVGRGTGVDDAGLERKRDVVRRALDLHGPHCRDVWDWLPRIGGFEILGLAGLAVAAARQRVLVVLDGLISAAAGLAAARLCPAIVGSFVAGHLGPEPGHRIALEALQLRPLLDLGLRLGEGTGAALALPLIAASADILRDMATFESAGISGPSGCP